MELDSKTDILCKWKLINASVEITDSELSASFK